MVNIDEDILIFLVALKSEYIGVVVYLYFDEFWHKSSDLGSCRGQVPVFSSYIGMVHVKVSCTSVQKGMCRLQFWQSAGPPK